MGNLWKIIIRNTIIVITIISVITATILWIYNNKNSLYKIVVENRNYWDITLLQNTIDNENFMGVLYEKDYNLNDLSDDIFTSLLINAYISQDDDFYTETDSTTFPLFSTTISKEKLEKVMYEKFGPNQGFHIKEGEYGCGKKIEKNENNYIISSNDPEYCGLFSNTEKRYISFISDYYKEKNDIIVKLKVGFIETKSEFIENFEEEEIISYNLYEDQTEKKLIEKNYDTDCIYGESTNESCYSKLPTYQVILKKDNGKYYFDSISKLS